MSDMDSNENEDEVRVFNITDFELPTRLGVQNFRIPSMLGEVTATAMVIVTEGDEYPDLHHKFILNPAQTCLLAAQLLNLLPTDIEHLFVRTRLHGASTLTDEESERLTTYMNGPGSNGVQPVPPSPEVQAEQARRDSSGQ